MTTLPIDNIDYLFADRCVGFAKRTCDAAPLPDSAYCPACKNALEGALMASLVSRLSAHVRKELAELPVVERVIEVAA
jgi:hypothetical protein